MKFVILGNLTQQGIKTIKDAGKRQKQAEEIMNNFGCKLLDLYYTMGKYDWVAIVEGPDIESAMKALFMFGVGGTNRTESLVAITGKEAVKLIGELP
ncbi:MAG: GYD domain-containing protein [Candidatus Thorarchaeota archaeon]